MTTTHINIDLSLPDIPVLDGKGRPMSPESRLLTRDQAVALRPTPALTNALVDALNAALVAGDVELTSRASLGIAAVAQAALDAKGWGVVAQTAGGATVLFVSDTKDPTDLAKKKNAGAAGKVSG